MDGMKFPAFAEAAGRLAGAEGVSRDIQAREGRDRTKVSRRAAKGRLSAAANRGYDGDSKGDGRQPELVLPSHAPTVMIAPLFVIARASGRAAHAGGQRRARKIIRPAAGEVGPENLASAPIGARGVQSCCRILEGDDAIFGWF